MENTIEFNHNYTKLHNQKSGFLCYVSPIIITQDFPEETLLYDTDGKYTLEQGKQYLQLVFLGDKEIPFTTYREDNPKNRHKYVGKERHVFDFIVKDDINETIDADMMRSMVRQFEKDKKKGN